jgi:hypothetical protein
MAKAELKTKPTGKSVEAFLKGLDNEKRMKDSLRALALMKKATGEKPKMWGDAIVGFGDYEYTGASGRSGDWFLAGFSPRKQHLVIYLMTGHKPFAELMTRLGKHKTSGGCIYIKDFDQIDESVLSELVTRSVDHMKKQKGQT